MKKSFAILVSLFSGVLFATSVFAQTPVNDGWSEIGNASYNSEIFSMSFVDSNIGYALGSGGAYLKTTDGGTSWTAQDIGVVLDLKQIIFRNDTLGYMHGSHGGHLSKFLRTIDGGSSWVEIPSTGGTAIYNMFFLSDSVGWLACDSKYYKTTNRGDTWDVTSMSGYNTIFDINFISNDTGFLASNSSNYLQRTTDGGNTWALSNNDYISDIEFPSTDNGYISKLTGSIPRMLRTTDQGASWTDAATGLSLGIKGMKFINDSTGFCWGSNYGRIYMTNNYGDSWGQVYNNPSAQINGVQISPSGVLYAFGKNGLILNSTNGTVWNTTHIGQINGTLNRVAFTDDNTGYIVGENGIVMKTLDAAVTWNIDNVGTTNHLRDINFISPSTGFIIGDGSKIYKTSNAGANWMSSNNGYTSSSQGYSIEMVNGSIGYAGGQNGVFKTENGGDNWTITANIDWSVSLQCFGADTILSGSLLKFFSSNNGGSSWNDFEMAHSIYSFYFFDSQYGFLGDSWGRIYKTTDGGATVTQKYNCSFNINELIFINDTTGYFVADGGYIGKTMDAGETWVQVASGTTRDLKGICFSADGTGYVVGKEGFMLRKAIVPTNSLSFNVTNLGGDQITDATLMINSASYPVGTYSVSGLIDGNYQYQISKTGYLTQSGTVSLFSDSIIDISLADLPIPTALNATDITHFGFTANWNNVSQADSYLLSVSADNFSTYLPGYDGLLVTGTSKVMDGLTHEASYSYKLKSQNTHGITNFSNAISVTTLPLPTYSMSFEILDLDGYPITDATLVLSSNSYPAGTYTVSGLFQGSYQYQISKTGYLNQSGTVSLVSDSIINISLADLDIPIALDATNVGCFGFTANWNTVSQADSYLLYVSADNFSTYLPGYDGLLVTGTSEIIDELTHETSYSYKIKSQSGYGITEFSNTISVTTLPLPSYSLSFDVVDLGGDPITDAVLMFNSVSYPAGTYSVLSLIEANYDYEISKTGYLTQSGTVHLVSDSSISVQLLLDLDVPVALDASNLTNTGFTANWNTVSQADSYLLSVSADNFNTCLPGYDGLLVTGTSKVMDGLTHETSYSYKLKSKNEHGITAFSNTISATTLQASKVKNIESLSLNIYPNPASQKIVISSGNEIIESISIIDSQGKILMNLLLPINPNESQVIDISKITKGCYLVVATCHDGSKRITKLTIE